MANNILTDPIRLDSAGNPISLGGREMVIFKHVEWVNPEEVDDRAYLLDSAGAVICDFTCVTPHTNQHKNFGDKGCPFTGTLNLSQLSSGYLLITRA